MDTQGHSRQQLARINKLVEAIKSGRFIVPNRRPAKTWPGNEYLKALRKHASDLAGKRLTPDEVAAIIGKPYSAFDINQLMGLAAAMVSFGALRRRIGRKRYYEFI